MSCPAFTDLESLPETPDGGDFPRHLALFGPHTPTRRQRQAHAANSGSPRQLTATTHGSSGRQRQEPQHGARQRSGSGSVTSGSAAAPWRRPGEAAVAWHQVNEAPPLGHMPSGLSALPGGHRSYPHIRPSQQHLNCICLYCTCNHFLIWPGGAHPTPVPVRHGPTMRVIVTHTARLPSTQPAINTMHNNHSQGVIPGGDPTE